MLMYHKHNKYNGFQTPRHVWKKKLLNARVLPVDKHEQYAFVVHKMVALGFVCCNCNCLFADNYVRDTPLTDWCEISTYCVHECSMLISNASIRWQTIRMITYRFIPSYTIAFFDCLFVIIIDIISIVILLGFMFYQCRLFSSFPCAISDIVAWLTRI